MGFYFYRRLSSDQKWSVPLYSACRLNAQTLWALAEAPAQRPADDPYAWDHRADTYLTEVKRFLFNVLLFLGSLPEEYEPDQVLRAAREKKGHLRPERSMNPPGANCRAIGELATGAGSLRGRELAAKADLDPTLQDDRPRR